MLETLYVFLTGLCWGSFLNVVGHRMLTGESVITKRSACPRCQSPLAWYDMVPLLSWLYLRARCRHCGGPISALYPVVEGATAIIMTALWYTVYPQGMAIIWPHVLFRDMMAFTCYGLFFSALIVGSRTDLQGMVVYQLTTVWLVPLGLFAAFQGFLRISFHESLIGLMCGYIVLWAIAQLFKSLAHKEGLGMGDIELVAMIGSFLGPLGVLFSVMIGSLLGLCVGSWYLFTTAQTLKTRIPFVPFLSFGAIIFFFFERYLVRTFIG